MRVALLLLALTLSACESPSTHSAHGITGTGAGNMNSLSEAARVQALEKADWKQMQSVDIELRDYGFTPQTLRLKAGQPYRLTITNTGSYGHYFNAPEFLHSIAARKAQVPHQAEMKAAFFTSFEIARRGGSMELYFVPMIAGSYKAHCHLEGKEHVGVTGTLVVE